MRNCLWYLLECVILYRNVWRSRRWVVYEWMWSMRSTTWSCNHTMQYIIIWQLLSNTKHTLKLITKNSRTVGGPYHQWGLPVTKRSSHPIVTPPPFGLYSIDQDWPTSSAVFTCAFGKFTLLIVQNRWLGSRVVSVLDLGAEVPGFKSQLRRCRVSLIGKRFTLAVPLFTEQRYW